MNDIMPGNGAPPDGRHEIRAVGRRQSPRKLRLGSVSYFNAKPLLFGLEQAADLDLMLDVPSGLLDGLRRRRFDLALLPAIDFQRLDGLRLVPSGGICSDGPTLTVRIFSKKPMERIVTLACDPDSHTSVALACILFARRFGRQPRLLPDGDALDAADARLLIGDKVVCEEPAGFDYQIDLGEAWKHLTGMPFVFAVWTAPGDVDLRDLPQRLAAARQQGLEHVEELIERHAIPRGWPHDAAQRYLTSYLQFDITPRHLEAMALFHQLAAEYGIIPSPCKPLRLYQ